MNFAVSTPLSDQDQDRGAFSFEAGFERQTVFLLALIVTSASWSFLNVVINLTGLHENVINTCIRLTGGLIEPSVSDLQIVLKVFPQPKNICKTHATCVRPRKTASNRLDMSPTYSSKC